MYCEKCGAEMHIVENGKNIGTVTGSILGGGVALCTKGATTTAGMAIGTAIMPGIGTAVGGLIGLLTGIVSGASVGYAVGSAIDNQLNFHECPNCKHQKRG